MDSRYFKPLPTLSFIAEAVNNNPADTVAQLNARGFDVNNGNQAVTLLLDLYEQGQIPTVENVLNNVPFIDRNDFFSNWVMVQTQLLHGPQPRVTFWEFLGGALTGIGEVLNPGEVGQDGTASNNAGGQQQDGQEEPSFMEQYGGLILAIIGIVVVSKVL